MKRYAKYIKQAKRLKVKDVKVIPVKSIVTAEWVRFKCRFGCDGYGQTLMCPPDSPTPDETRKMLAYYEYALLIHGDEETDITRIVSILEKNIFLDGYYKAFAMGAGPCQLCAKCAKFCRHAEKARPSIRRRPKVGA